LRALESLKQRKRIKPQDQHDIDALDQIFEIDALYTTTEVDGEEASLINVVAAEAAILRIILVAHEVDLDASDGAPGPPVRTSSPIATTLSVIP